MQSAFESFGELITLVEANGIKSLQGGDAVCLISKIMQLYIRQERNLILCQINWKNWILLPKEFCKSDMLNSLPCRRPEAATRHFGLCDLQAGFTSAAALFNWWGGGSELNFLIQKKRKKIDQFFFLFLPLCKFLHVIFFRMTIHRIYGNSTNDTSPCLGRVPLPVPVTQITLIRATSS